MFFEFSDFKNFFLTFLFDMVLIGYIDANNFLLDYKSFQEGGLMVFSQLKRICSQKTKLGFLNFLISKIFFCYFLLI